MIAAVRHPVFVGAVAAIVAACAGLLLAAGAGTSPAVAVDALVEGMTGTPYAIGSSLNTAAVLALIAAGFTVAYRAGLVNVGGEGQLCVGGVTGAAAGLALPQGVPGWIGVPVVLIAGFAGGAAWASIAGLLKAKRGTSEVITTLLLNFVGAGVLALAVHEEALLRQPVTSAETLPQSAPLPPGARLPLIGSIESPATLIVVLAVAAALIVALVLRHTPTGLRLTAVGHSPAASARLGLGVARLEVGGLAVAGGLAGAAGACLVATAPYVLAEHFSSGYGFTGLVVGLLARGSLTAVLAIALLFGLLTNGGINLQLAAGVPAASVQVVQSLLVLLIAASMIWTRKGAR
ncbi:simple sugar transport system permease protein [Actinoplanes lutulentus]|uniref:Nucleoside ABC transporter membrane protein n=1 Tax=Actinoplanes lutulentus TaxID=1287878 RepID=A0A327YZU9_9ACTN|nr:ABC transporter permease [Actinoplanes lutulentus]MBB2943070.1 simple sugar transport system permease protein [Actinoplanes lutulentus]RAK26664.1 nucleoside ABC transporter membrane protein [Actinoplanes lutulentus]